MQHVRGEEMAVARDERQKVAEFNALRARLMAAESNRRLLAELERESHGKFPEAESLLHREVDALHKHLSSVEVQRAELERELRALETEERELVAKAHQVAAKEHQFANEVSMTTHEVQTLQAQMKQIEEHERFVSEIARRSGGDFKHAMQLVEEDAARERAQAAELLREINKDRSEEQKLRLEEAHEIRRRPVRFQLSRHAIMMRREAALRRIALIRRIMKMRQEMLHRRAPTNPFLLARARALRHEEELKRERALERERSLARNPLLARERALEWERKHLEAKRPRHVWSALTDSVSSGTTGGVVAAGAVMSVVAVLAIVGVLRYRRSRQGEQQLMKADPAGYDALV